VLDSVHWSEASNDSAPIIPALPSPLPCHRIEAACPQLPSASVLQSWRAR